MTFPPIDKSFMGLMRDITTRLTLVERRLATGAPTPVTPDATVVTEGYGTDVTGDGSAATPYKISTGGTTAERDARYGAVPTTDPARVALANQKPVWFNSDLGWEEGYYATTGLSGLTARGLVAGSASGWYPIATGPNIFVVPSGPQTLSTGNVFTNMADPGTGLSYRRGGTAYLTHTSGVITVVKAGRYRVRALLGCQTGSGSALMYLIRNNNPALIVAQDSQILNASYYTVYQMLADSVVLTAGDTLRIYIAAASGVIFAPGTTSGVQHLGQLFVEYIGPSLVTE